MAYKKINNVSDLKGDFVLFKHSDSCSISARAKVEVDKVAHQFDVFILVVQEQGTLSREIADQLNIEHESPQVIIRKRDQMESFSHYDINAKTIEDILV